VSISSDIRVISSEQHLRELIGSPTDTVMLKLADRVYELTREFIERSPFVCLATSMPDGGLDISPKGDPAGFVRILDERTLLLPDRPGNRIADSLTNLLHDPRVALLFFVPGVTEMFRVNGTAVITDDAGLLAPSAVEGKVPKLGLLISVQEAYTHCSKAALRSEIWNPDRFIDRDELPSNGEILRSLSDPDFDAAGYDQERAARYARREGFY
jgi:PPOX class probable FMN-dependent enzyme